MLKRHSIQQKLLVVYIHNIHILLAHSLHSIRIPISISSQICLFFFYFVCVFFTFNPLHFSQAIKHFFCQNNRKCINNIHFLGGKCFSLPLNTKLTKKIIESKWKRVSPLSYLLFFLIFILVVLFLLFFCIFSIEWRNISED